MSKNFIRRGITSPLRFQGRPIPFQDFGADVGGIQIEESQSNQPVIDMLTDYANRKLGGVVVVTDEEYEAEKKVSSDEQSRLNKLAAQLQRFSPVAQPARVAATSDPLAQNPVQALPAAKMAPPAVRVEPTADDGMIHGPMLSFQKPMTTEEYALMHKAKAAEAESVAPPKVTEEPTVAKLSDLTK
jgi:hypothetical protein